MPVDALSSAGHYRAHLLPAWEALPPAVRGLRLDLDGPGLPAVDARGRSALVASARDMAVARRRGYARIAMLEHGAGQAYAGLGSPSYPGGPGRDAVSLFLSPNEAAAGADRRAYPRAAVRVVGDPAVGTLPGRAPGPGPVVAVSAHWDWWRLPETRWAWPHFAPALPALAADPRWTLLGHAHPRSADRLAPEWRRLGVEFEPDWRAVLRRADLYACDNSSTIFEFAATGRPVVLMDAPCYRRDVSHGGRFWDWADAGVRASRPDQLADAVALALSDPPAVRAERERVLSLVYGPDPAGAARRAAAAVAEWAS